MNFTDASLPQRASKYVSTAIQQGANQGRNTEMVGYAIEHATESFGGTLVFGAYLHLLVLLLMMR